jgi:hypothetical protein
MSGFLQRIKEKQDVWEEAAKGVQHLREDYPTVYSILAGQAPKPPETGVVPGSIRLFSNGGVLKFVVSGREWLYDTYGVCPEGFEVLQGIEREINAGNISMKAVSERKDPKTPF